MKLSEIVSLLKAGYTKKEIEDLRANETSAETTNPDMPTSAVDLQPEEAPPAATPAAAAAPAGPDNAEVLKAIQDLTKAIQAQNIRNSQLEIPKQDSAVDILGSIINNNIKKE